MGFLFLDVVMVFLLMAFIVYTMQLNKRLTSLSDANQQLGPLITNLSTMMNQTSANIVRLKTLAAEVNATLGDKLPQALSLKDELGFIVDHAEKVAHRLDNLVDHAPKAEPFTPFMTAPMDPDDDPIVSIPSLHAEEPLSIQRNEARFGIMEALKNVR